MVNTNFQVHKKSAYLKIQIETIQNTDLVSYVTFADMHRRPKCQYMGRMPSELRDSRLGHLLRHACQKQGHVNIAPGTLELVI